MPSPPRPLRHSPPRRPLHDRSDSSTNERISPTVRIIGDPLATIYSSTPFPTHPSHILSPKTSRQGGAVLEDVGVSDPHGPTWQEHVSEDVFNEGTWATTAQEKTTNDSEDTSNGSNSPPWPLRNSRHLSPTPNVSRQDEEGEEQDGDFDANDRSFIMDQAMDEDRHSEEIVQLPSVDSGSDTLDLHTFTSIHSPHQQPVVAKSSEASLSSTESAGTVIVTRPRDRPSRASYSAFPSSIRQDNSKADTSDIYPTAPVNVNPENSPDTTSPVSPVSPESPTTLFPRPLATSHRAISLPRSDLQDEVNVQYPVIRPPSALESWAETSEPSSKRPSTRNPNRARWNPHLSTVESLGMTDRSSGSLHLPDSSRVSKNSTRAPNSRSETPPLPAFPRSAHTSRRDITASTIRVVNEQDDYVHSSLAPVPGSRGSTRFSIFSSSSKGDNQRVGLQQITRPSSRGSFFRDSIPAWARYVYFMV